MIFFVEKRSLLFLKSVQFHLETTFSRSYSATNTQVQVRNIPDHVNRCEKFKAQLKDTCFQLGDCQKPLNFTDVERITSMPLEWEWEWGKEHLEKRFVAASKATISFLKALFSKKPHVLVKGNYKFKTVSNAP